jgi:hypothetical protein
LLKVNLKQNKDFNNTAPHQRKRPQESDLKKEKNLIQGLAALTEMGPIIQKKEEEQPAFRSVAQSLNKHTLSPQPKSSRTEKFPQSNYNNIFSQSLNL